MLHPSYNLIRDIHDVYKEGELISWNHIYREVNQVTDGLVKHAMEEDLAIIFSILRLALLLML